MKPGRKDGIRGKLQEVEQAVKEKAGPLMNNPGMALDGQDGSLSAKVHEKVGQIKKVFGM